MGRKRETKAPAPPKSPPLVAGTGQAWKVTLGLGGMTVAAVASIVQFFGPEVVKQPAIGVAVVLGLLGLGTLWTVRCPSCEQSLSVWAFQTGSLTTWHERLVEVTACPSCGFAVPEKRS